MLTKLKFGEIHIINLNVIYVGVYFLISLITIKITK